MIVFVSVSEEWRLLSCFHFRSILLLKTFHMKTRFRTITLLCITLLLIQCTAQNDTTMQPIFPTLQAELLTGEAVIFPDHVKGKKAMITLVFEKRGAYQTQQFQSDTWQQFWRDTLQAKGIEFYEIPMMSGLYRPIKRQTDYWMRAGIPEPFHKQVACFYGQKRKYAQALAIEDIGQCYACVIDEGGQILWSETGAVTPEKQEQLLAILNN